MPLYKHCLHLVASDQVLFRQVSWRLKVCWQWKVELPEEASIVL